VAVESIRDNATRYTGDQIGPGNVFVWVIEVAGHFACVSCSPSLAAATPSPITAILDFRIFAVAGVGLRDSWLDLSHLGFVHVLKP
jgi:hypothetical protein